MAIATTPTDYQWLENLITETHDYVDQMRAERGLPPWKWRNSPNPDFRVLGPLVGLIKIVDMEGNEMARDYSCRARCGFVGTSPSTSAEHYRQHPDHKLSPYDSKKLKTSGGTVAAANTSGPTSRRPKPRSSAPVRVRSAFDQLRDLKNAFAAEIDRESIAIKEMDNQMRAKITHLDELKSTYRVLVTATGYNNKPNGISNDTRGQDMGADPLPTAYEDSASSAVEVEAAN